jgi:tetratricopeptide (TPR) repeat protein
MPKIQIPRFNTRDEFQLWWKTPQVKAFLTKYPDKIAVLSEHPSVKPFADIIRGTTPTAPEHPENAFGKYRLLRKIKAVQDALAIDPTYGDAYQEIGFAYYDKGEYDEAYKALTRAI